eukprot:XP_016656977.1 PREDICTED: uncharacterized protein LOC100568979 [Acyrthosiphon pisum]
MLLVTNNWCSNFLLQLYLFCLPDQVNTNIELENLSTHPVETQSFSAVPSNTELLDLLQSANEGRALLATFQQSGLLNSIGRKRLCNIIINKELRDDVYRRVPTSRLQELAFQITTIFPKEHSATYFIPYILYGPGLKRSAKGKLLDCLYNRTREYRKSGLINSSRCSSTLSSSSGRSSPITVRLLNDREENDAITVEENLKWLRNSSDPWDLVERHWSATTNTRLKKLMSKDGQTISEYMSEYPSLKKPTGYLPILKDFDVTHPESSDKLFQNLPLFKNRIFKLAEEKIKKSKELTTNDLLKEYIQLGTEENEGSFIAAFLCLPFLIGVSITKGKRTKTQWKPSKVEMRDGFITHLLSNAEVEETISRRREKLNDVSETGIKDKCVWFDVNNFSLFDQVGVDVMHDMLEGCSKYIMKFILLYYTKELKLFSLQVLNDRINGFDFGPENNKPCSLTLDNINQGNIKQSASEMLTLIRYFGLLVGDFIPPEEPVWELYIVMRRVMDILMSTSLTIDSCSMLQTLVAEMNELYLSYSNSHLKPKFHFLTHYHSMVRKLSPVISFWSMRYEAKHRISKISAKSSFNRRNICMTLAIRHQLHLNEMFTKGKLNKSVIVGPQKEIDSIKACLIQTELNLDTVETLIRVKWAEVKGTRYKPKTILTLDIMNDNNPNFVIVKDIFLYGPNRVIFECSKFTTIGFDEHVFCYEVTSPEINYLCFIFQDLLISPIPNTINVVSNGIYYITVRSPL